MTTNTTMETQLDYPNLKRTAGPGRPRTVADTPAAKLIDRLLKEHNWTLYDLAAKAGVPYQRVQEYVRGTHKPSAKALSRLLAPIGLMAVVEFQIRELETNRLVEILEDKPSEPAATNGEMA